MEDSSRARVVPVDHDLNDLQRRASKNSQGKSLQEISAALSAKLWGNLKQAPATLRRYPRRYALHLMLLIVVPIALSAGQFRPRMAPANPQPDPLDQNNANTLAEWRPTDLHTEGIHTGMAGDLPISDPDLVEDTIDLEIIRERKLALSSTQPLELPVLTTWVEAESANLRNGPGTAFDKIELLETGTELTALAIHETWVQVEVNGQPGWIASDLIGLGEEQLASLPKAENVPVPPPPLVGQVLEEGLNLRDGPGTDYIGMTKLPEGTTLDLHARYGDWFQVETDKGTVGWVTAEYLGLEQGVLDRVPETSSIPSANPALIGMVIESSINLREGPNTQYKSLGKLADGTELDLVGRYKDWFKVQTPKGTTGWVSSSLLEVSSFVTRRVPYTEKFPALPKPQPKPKPAAKQPSAPVSVSAGSASALAWQFVGSRYIYGGASPSGFDCSGFTQYVYRQFGVSLPHSAASQWNYGVHIGSMNNLQPGDLMFFVGTVPGKRGISHVGMYVGDGIMIHAGTPRSGVQAVNIWGSYWVNHYYGAVRL